MRFEIPPQLADADDTGLLVVAGSHAYGLETPDSDVDYRGFFMAPTRDLLGVRSVKETRTWTDPDVSMHEVGKFCRLALEANPTVLEVLAIEDPVVTSPLADDLRANLGAFLSDRVRMRFGGYARSQFHRLKKREGSFSADTQKRTAKHARHLLRLVRQGAHLMETGELRVRVDDRDELFAFGELPYEEMIPVAEAELDRFDKIPSTLPPEPDFDLVHDILVGHRLALIGLPDSISGGTIRG